MEAAEAAQRIADQAAALFEAKTAAEGETAEAAAPAEEEPAPTNSAPILGPASASNACHRSRDGMRFV